MAKPTKLTEVTVAYARQLVQTARDVDSLRRGLAVLLPAETGITQARAADLLGVGVATIKRYQEAAYQRAHGANLACPQRGGRRNETMPLEAESAFLETWRERAARGEAVFVKRMREDLQRRRGARIPLYTMYRILARHGWRKVAPDTKHPTGAPVAQEAFKKTSPPNWLPPYEPIAEA